MTAQEFQEVVRALEEMPGHVRQLAAGMAAQDLKWKPSDDEFSVLEQVCHLRDLEREGYGVRIKKLLAEHRPRLPDFCGGRIARERDYNRQDFESALREFALARRENVRVMKRLSPEQLNESGHLEGVGAITLGELFLLMREHDRSHKAELSDLLRARLSEAKSEGGKRRPQDALLATAAVLLLSALTRRSPALYFSLPSNCF